MQRNTKIDSKALYYEEEEKIIREIKLFNKNSFEQGGKLLNIHLVQSIAHFYPR